MLDYLFYAKYTQEAQNIPQRNSASAVNV